VLLPQAVRDAHGWKPGAELEIIDGGRGVALEAVGTERKDALPKLMTAREFLDSLPKYEGPPVDLSPEAIRQAIDELAIEDWERLERQWNEDKDD
jgi:bifunctional DNA-binding transcriptional regulator/antitoxin component of YhaV-PrlF toxin-antitoxin module